MKTKDGYIKLIEEKLKGDINSVLLSDGGSVIKSVTSTANSLVQRNASGQIESSVAANISPFNITSTTLNANLNADLLDGKHLSEILSSNVASASKLNTPRDIWGQSFNGESDVDGTLHINVSSNNYTEGIRIYQNSNGRSGILLGSKNLNSTTGTDSNSWFISNDASGAFSINKGSQGCSGTFIGYDGTWKLNGNTILHSTNYNNYATKWYGQLDDPDLHVKPSLGYTGASNVPSSVNSAGLVSPIVNEKYGGQLLIPSNDQPLYFRNFSNSTWTSWKKVIDETNYDDYALPLTGGDLKGNLDLGKYNLIFSGSDSGDIVWNSGGNTPTEIHRLYSLNNDVESLAYRHKGGTSYYLLHTGNYSNYALPLSGGIITTTSSYYPLRIKCPSSYGQTGIRLEVDNTNMGSFVSTIDNTYIYNFKSSLGIGIYDGVAKIGNNIIWHSGNDGSDSGLDADLLDGYHASDMVGLCTYHNTQGFTVKTNIARTSNKMLYIKIEGNSYHSYEPLLTIAQAYNYEGNSFSNGMSVANIGKHKISYITFFHKDELVHFYVPITGSYKSVSVYVSDIQGLTGKNRATEIISGDLSSQGINVTKCSEVVYNALYSNDSITSNYVNRTLTNPTTKTWYQINWGNSSTLRYNDGIGYGTKQGTTTELGESILEIGNTAAEGADGNKEGRLRICGPNQYYGEIIGPNSNYSSFKLPNTGGTFVTHPTRGTAVGSYAKPVYIESSGQATPITITDGSEGKRKMLVVGSDGGIYSVSNLQANYANGDIESSISTSDYVLHSVSNNKGKVGIYAAESRGLYDFTNADWLIATSSNNTYLMHGNVGIGTTSPSTKLEVSGKTKISKNLQLNNNFHLGLSSYNGSDGEKGTVVITLPVGNVSSMTIVEIDLYIYDLSYKAYNSRHTKLLVSFYNYSDKSFYSSGYSVIGNYNRKVRLAYNGSKCCILLGETSDTWNYGKIHVSKVLSSLSNSDSFNGDYSISITTSESSLTNITSVGRLAQTFGEITATAFKGPATSSGYLTSIGNKSVSDLSSTYPKGLSLGNIVSGGGWPFAYGSIITAFGNNGAFQIAGQWNHNVTATNSDFITEMYIRGRRDSYDTWTTWTRVLTDRNYSSILDGTYAKKSEYLPLTGGTLKGQLIMGETTNTAWMPIKFNRNSKEGFIGMGSVMEIGQNSGYLQVGNSTLKYSNGTDTYQIWHQGNHGSGSGLDADKWDGKHWSDLVIGGRNYLVDSAKEFGGNYEYQSITITDFVKNHLGEIFTISAEIKTPVAGTVSMYSLGRYNVGFNVYKTLEANKWTKIQGTGTFSDNGSDPNGNTCSLSWYGTYGTGRNIYVRNVKIEKGTKATDWTPALEDSSVTGGGSSWGSSITVKVNGTSKTLTIPNNPNTWRSITDSYSGTDSTISLSQKGANSLYNALLNGYASSAETATSASYVKDYNSTTSPIYIGYSGNALTTATHLAAYGTTSDGSRCIKNISVATVKTLLEVPTVYSRNLGINGNNWTFYSLNSNATTSIYAPTSSGKSGQLLQAVEGSTPKFVNATAYTYYNSTVGYLVKTNILSGTATMIHFTIEGNSYGQGDASAERNIFTTGQAYIYNSSSILETSVKHHGLNFGDVYVMYYNNYVYLWFNSTNSYQTFSVKVTSHKDTLAYNRVTEITSQARPSVSVYRKITPVTTVDSLNIGSQSVNYANSAGTAASANYATSAGSVAWGNVSSKPTLYRPATYGTTTMPSSGYYKIKINSATSWMLAFNIKVYKSYHYFNIRCSGYNYGTSYWHAPAASLVDSDKTSINVYFGYDSAWNLWVAIPYGNYTGIEISDVVNGYTQTGLEAKDLFTITYQSSLSGTLQSTQTAIKYKHSVVTSMPSTPDTYTIYMIT